MACNDHDTPWGGQAMSHFQQHYAQLHDDELVAIALNRELMPEASEALKTELARRGITDLSAQQAERQQERSAEVAHLGAKVARQHQVIAWRTRCLCVIAAACCAYGAYRLANPNPERPGDDGGLMLALGVAMFLFAGASSWLSRRWSQKVLYRGAPR
jgi:hypothetical protein